VGPKYLVKLPQHANYKLSLRFSKRNSVNEAVTGKYIVEIATVSPAPDVDIHTVNGPIDMDIYFLGGLPRRIGVSVQSTNGQIRLALPEQQHAQHLDIRVESVNGKPCLKRWYCSC